MKYRKVEVKDVLAVFWRILVLIIIEVTTAALLIESGHMFWWGLILLGLIFWIVSWHCHYFGYECDKCGHKQQINFLKEFGSLNLVNRKYLKCEKCKKWNRAKILVVNKV